MFRWIENNPLKTILFTGMLIFVNLNVIPVGIMEARNFVTAREMITTGHWLLTTMNDTPRYEKPPLPTWLTAFSGILFGIKSVYFLRVPAALMAIALSLVTYVFSLQLTSDKKQSLVNALILITSFYIINIIFEAPVDIFAHGFMLAGISFLFLVFREKQHLWRNALAAGLLTGFSILSKGPIALYGLFLPFIIAYGIAFKFSGLKAKVFPLVVFIITSLVIGGSWFVYVRLADPKTFIDILSKETSNWGTYQVKPFYYYWTFFVQTGVWTIFAFVSLLFPYFKDKVGYKREYYFSLLWTALSVLLLSFIPEKKPRYLVPVLIPLVINTGFYIHYLIQNFRNMDHWLEKVPVYLSFGLISLLGITVPIVGYITFGYQLHDVWLNFSVTALAMFILAVLIFAALINKDIQKVFALTVSFIVVIMSTGLPILRSINVNPEFKNINELSVADNKIHVYGFIELAPEMIWHYGKPIPVINSVEQNVPQDKIFSVLVNPAYEDDFRRVISKVGTIELIETFDINYFRTGKKNHSNRLVCNHYLVKVDG